MSRAKPKAGGGWGAAGWADPQALQHSAPNPWTSTPSPGKGAGRGSAPKPSAPRPSAPKPSSTAAPRPASGVKPAGKSAPAGRGSSGAQPSKSSGKSKKDGVEDAEPALDDGSDGDDSEEEAKPNVTGRRKISIKFIEDKGKRHITFSKRKSGILKKAKELASLTGAQVLLVVSSETGNVYDYSSHKFKQVLDECKSWLKEGGMDESKGRFSLAGGSASKGRSNSPVSTVRKVEDEEGMAGMGLDMIASVAAAAGSTKPAGQKGTESSQKPSPPLNPQSSTKLPDLGAQVMSWAGLLNCATNPQTSNTEPSGSKRRRSPDDNAHGDSQRQKLDPTTLSSSAPQDSSSDQTQGFPWPNVPPQNKDTLASQPPEAAANGQVDMVKQFFQLQQMMMVQLLAAASSSKTGEPEGAGGGQGGQGGQGSRSTSSTSQPLPPQAFTPEHFRAGGADRAERSRKSEDPRDSASPGAAMKFLKESPKAPTPSSSKNATRVEMEMNGEGQSTEDRGLEGSSTIPSPTVASRLSRRKGVMHQLPRSTRTKQSPTFPKNFSLNYEASNEGCNGCSVLPKLKHNL